MVSVKLMWLSMRVACYCALCTVTLSVVEEAPSCPPKWILPTGVKICDYSSAVVGPSCQPELFLSSILTYSVLCSFLLVPSLMIIPVRLRTLNSAIHLCAADAAITQ